MEMKKRTPVKEVALISKTVAEEGIVLLKNDKNVLPVNEGETVSVFGRTQFDYVKSGTGSGGKVNVKYLTNITDSLKEYVNVNAELEAFYRKWIEENPFDIGSGWASQPWFQKEAYVSDELIKKAAETSCKALVVIGRTAGEDKDNSAEKGSYFLTDEEYDLIKRVCASFDKVCVLLNVGNVIDMTWVKELNVPSVMYIWQGGMEGGAALANVVCGKTSPSGKLADTIVKSLDKCPAIKNFGSLERNFYTEDVYVGYRYYETFSPEDVLYPFGYGISYTQFDIEHKNTRIDDENISLNFTVKNIGNASGKEVLQVYYSAPQGYMGNPARQLVSFEKTKLLNPGESENITITFPICAMKTYCDFGEYKSCCILEKGDYVIFAGNNVRDAKKAAVYTLSETKVLEKLESAMAPTLEFERIKPVKNGGKYEVSYEKVPLRDYDLNERIIKNRPADMKITGNKNITLKDAAEGRNTYEEFIAQLSEEELMCIARGEGMNSPKVTPGTGCAFGAVTKELYDYKIPVACGTDGPSGLRLDDGAYASSIPAGCSIASTWNAKLIEELFEAESKELLAYDIDALLGPGINIHRTPLNGRNFEYFSEDPYLTGVMGTAVSKGLSKHGTYAVIKHFVGNEQEHKRYSVDSVISERALREIYLKPFEMAVKCGGAKFVMTSYNPVNGIYTAGNYDLNTTILRNEWGFDGIVMTDWWAAVNYEGEDCSKTNLAAMVSAQNDIYMVTPDAKTHEDNMAKSLEDGKMTLGELQRNAINICKTLTKVAAFNSDRNVYDDLENAERIFVGKYEGVSKFDLRTLHGAGKYEFNITYRVDASPLSQNTVKIIGGTNNDVLVLAGTDGKKAECVKVINTDEEPVRFEFDGNDCVKFESILLSKIK